MEAGREGIGRAIQAELHTKESHLPLPSGCMTVVPGTLIKIVPQPAAVEVPVESCEDILGKHTL